MGDYIKVLLPMVVADASGFLVGPLVSKLCVAFAENNHHINPAGLVGIYIRCMWTPELCFHNRSSKRKTRADPF